LFGLDSLVLVAGIGGGIGIYTAAIALGFRHGIDWDHIAAITDITSASASVDDEDEVWLMGEPGLMLTDESHHSVHRAHEHGEGEEHHHHEELDHEHDHFPSTSPSGGAATATLVREPPAIHALTNRLPRAHRQALWLGSLYALGHGSVVILLGILAIVASEVLPDWIDPVMERVVGVTLIFLSFYLFYSLYQYFRGGEFRLRSRWMLVFAGVRNAWGWLRSHTGSHEHVHVAPQQAYGSRAAFGIGLIHGIGAETGTQALIIATAVGATSKSVAIAALLCFVVGLLISNSFVTVTSTFGFVSATRRQTIYVAAGAVAAVFSLVVGLVFLNASTGILPDLDQYIRWIGGPK
jgi:hypothetical protein